MELIKIREQDGSPVVSARELYKFLEVREKFTEWIARMFFYGFEENIDYVGFSEKSEKPLGGRPSIDFALKLNCAKEISMLQRSPQGKQARRYFIQCEEDLLKITKRLLSPKELAQMVIDAENEKEKYQMQLQSANNRLSEQAPKVLFADAVSASKNSILVGELAKIIKQNGTNIGQNRLFEALRVKGYLIKRIGSDHNMPTQKSMDMELFEIKETSITHSDGHITVTKTPKVTGKGQVYFINQFCGKKI